MTGPTRSRAEISGTEPARGRPWLRRLLGALLVFLVACLLASPIVIHTVRTYRVINPIDEPADIDYLNQVDHGQFVVGQGQVISRFTQEALVCRGFGSSLVPADVYTLYRAPIPADCARGIYPYTLDPGDTASNPPTRDTADIDPPTYYVVTDVGVRVLRGLGVTHDLIDAGRLMGIFWAGLGLSLLFALARMLGARRLPSALVCFAVLGSSGFYSYWCIVNPHATDLAVGAGTAILALWWFRGRLATPWMVLTGLLPPLFKGSDILVTGLVVVFALVASIRPGAVHDGGPSRRSALWAAAWSAFGLVVSSAAFELVRRHYRLSKVADFAAPFHVTGFHASYVLDEIGSFTQPFQNSGGTAEVVWTWCLGAAVLFAVGTVVTRFARSGAAADPGASPEAEVDGLAAGAPGRRELAIAVLPLVAFGSIGFVLSNFALLHQYHPIKPRYGLTITPTVLALGAVVARSRWVWAIAVLLLLALGYQAYETI